MEKITFVVTMYGKDASQIHPLDVQLTLLDRYADVMVDVVEK